MDDDHALLRAYLENGSETAFAQLVDRYLPLVHNAALRRMKGDESRAREVTQMVFSELAQKAAKLTRHSALAAWLYQSARWHAANLWRAERRRARHEAAAAEHMARLAAPESGLSWEALRPVLDEALDSLRAADRDAVLQRYFMDQPFAVMGRQLGVTENAARMRVERALDTLRQALVRYGITSTGAALSLVLVQHGRAAVSSELTAGVITSTACKAAAAGTIAATGATLLMTKSAIGLVGACAVALSTLWWRQEDANARLVRELATLQAASREAPAPLPAASPPELSPQVQRELEDAILAAAEVAGPLTPEQQERVNLDTIVRKGALDNEYAMLFRELNLPPATLDALKTLLVERNQAIYDAKQLAKEEGLVFASVAEEKAVANSALGEIDTRITALIGADGYAKLREYADFSFYRGLAEMALRSRAPASASADDERVRELARRLRQNAPGYEELLFQRNGWPGDEPLAVRETIASFLGQAPRPPDMWMEPQAVTIERRMREIERDALLQGVISMDQLSGRVAAEYRAARERLKNASAP